MKNFLRYIKAIVLCLRFPFLYPRNIWDDKPIQKYPNWTLLDAMDDGWRKAFGIKMCKEIRWELIKHFYLFKYRIVEIKEKMGILSWSDKGTPKKSKIDDIINKYEEISSRTCIICGKPAKYISLGWICPYCENCVGEREKIEIEKYYE